MQFTALVQDDEAVSPVIGVILMVAITVILAAVIGTFVLGLGNQLDDNAPQASFTFDFDSSGAGEPCNIEGSSGTDGELTITHDGGDKIAASQLSIVAGGGSDDWNSCASSSTVTDVAAGDSANPVVKDEDTVRVVWESSNGGDSATLGKWTGPDA